jgi:hypothetical protein
VAPWENFSAIKHFRTLIKTACPLTLRNGGESPE